MAKLFLRALQTVEGEDYKHCITKEMVEKVDTIRAYQSLIDATYLKNKSNNTSIILEQELFKLQMERVEDIIIMIIIKFWKHVKRLDQGLII